MVVPTPTHTKPRDNLVLNVQHQNITEDIQ
ncbi:hypothetical protein Pint_27177 [Pistacia integerrima]|uniref:Uncharacterized protein n=1 Tax=Pistacia integerrima TaxID=434235 RepID=A0ACC0YU42_9ROSI|nr:hypothetical protein Pint_27177 [Pistacia integerrima]